jgi:hypothetical protein
MASGELEGAFMISKPFGARSSTIARQSFGPTTRIRSTIISPPEQHDNLTFLFAERKISAARGIRGSADDACRHQIHYQNQNAEDGVG